MDLPSASNPYVLPLSLSVPSLKNNRDLRVLPSGRVMPAKNEVVRKFLFDVETRLLPLYPRSQYPTIPRPRLAGVWVDLHFYAANPKKALPRRDGDNALTTLQEMLQTQDKSSGIFGFVEDDSQFGYGSYAVHYVQDRRLDGAVIYCWALENSLNIFQELIALGEYRQQYKERLLHVGHTEQENVLVSELFGETGDAAAL